MTKLLNLTDTTYRPGRKGPSGNQRPDGRRERGRWRSKRSYAGSGRTPPTRPLGIRGRPRRHDPGASASSLRRSPTRRIRRHRPSRRVNSEHPNQNSERLVPVSYSGEHALLDRYRYRPCVSVASSLALSIWAALIPAACWRWQSCDAPCPGLMQSMRTWQPNWPWSRRE